MNRQKKLNFVKIEGLKFVEKKVEVELPVEQFTEAQKQVGLKILNLPDSVYMRLFPHQVKVSYLVGLKDYETISEEQFELEIDYSSIDLESNKVKVNLKNSPLNISNVSFYPEEVVYLIEKRN